MAPTRPTPVTCVLLDIEGTTTPVSFVYDTLFPYARARLGEFLAREHTSADVRADLAALREEHARSSGKTDLPPLAEHPPEAMLASATAYLHRLMDADSKAAPLKSLQGKIWEEGYRTGQLRGEVYADVLPAFRRWRRAGLDIAIYSSGSVLAQKLLFSHTAEGDLTPFLTAFFDTEVGPKREPASYSRIGAALGRNPAEVLFISDVSAELEAARSAGMQTLLCVRPGAPDAPGGQGHGVIHTFDEVLP